MASAFRHGVRVMIGAMCAGLWGSANATQTRAFELDLPLACALDSNCFIQNFVDIDPGPGHRDFTCGSATYNGHKGIDFRLVSTAAVQRNIPVLAAAAGLVKRRRDGMTDRLYKSEQNATIMGRECGNGLVIDHGSGWQTQYCHMRRGSLRVKPGQRVRRGDFLGFVGYSGKAAFAHLHLTVRHDGRIIDPFSGRAVSEANGCTAIDQADAGRPRSEPNTIWSRTSGLRSLKPGVRIIEARFLGSIVKPVASEAGLARGRAPTPTSPVLIIAARLINLSAGDRIQLSLSGPGGIVMHTQTKPLARFKASYGVFGGKKRRGKPWTPGRYEASIAVLRKGRTVQRRIISFDMN